MLSLAQEVLEKKTPPQHITNRNSVSSLKRVFPVGSIDDLVQGIALVDKKHPDSKSLEPLSQEAKIFFRSARTYIGQTREKYSYGSEDPSFQEKTEKTMTFIEHIPDALENIKILLRETVVGDIVRGYGEERF